MNIAIDIRNIGRGRTGSEVVVRELVCQLLKIDRDNKYFLITDTDDNTVIEYINNVLNLDLYDNVELYSLASYGRGDWILRSCPRFVKKHNIDVFHTEYIVPFFLPKNTYVITHIHDVSFKAIREKIGKKDLFFLDNLIPRSLKRANKIIAVSEFTKNEIIKYYPFTQGKICVIYNALSSFFKKEVTEEDKKRVKEKYEIPDDFILSIGTMQPRKNIPFLIKSFIKISDRLPNTFLLLTGKKTKRFDDAILKALDEAPFAKDKIRFLGFVDDEDLPALYNLSKVFAYPSLYEGFGLPILEALSQNIPTIVSDIPVHHEIAEDGAIYFDPNDIDQCSEMMYHVYTSKQTRNDLITRAKVQSKVYSWDKTATQFLDIINSLNNAPNYYMKKTMKDSYSKKTSTKSKKKYIIAAILVLTALFFGYFFYKANSTVNKITTKGGIISSFTKKITGKEVKLKGEEEGRINIAILGMRGKGVVGGGQLADTIIIASFIRDNKEGDKENYDISLMSVPRDLFVTTPDGRKAKINYVYAEGAQKGEGQGLEYMKKMLSEVVGQPIHYAASINFKAFSDVVDALGGVEITRDKEFIEPVQFYDKNICDGDKGGVFTIPIPGDFDIKYKKNGKISAKYPYCLNKDAECGGVFKVPAGTTNLNGEQALCYVRARATSSDFDRARRQQEVIGILRQKATNIGTLDSIGKINKFLSVLGNNVQVDLEPWEMERIFNLYVNKVSDKKIKAHKVLENTEKGLLYAPAKTESHGYTLLPRGNDYSQIHKAFENILDN